MSTPLSFHKIFSRIEKMRGCLLCLPISKRKSESGRFSFSPQKFMTVITVIPFQNMMIIIFLTIARDGLTSAVQLEWWLCQIVCWWWWKWWWLLTISGYTNEGVLISSLPLLDLLGWGEREEKLYTVYTFTVHLSPSSHFHFQLHLFKRKERNDEVSTLGLPFDDRILPSFLTVVSCVWITILFPLLSFTLSRCKLGKQSEDHYTSCFVHLSCVLSTHTLLFVSTLFIHFIFHVVIPEERERSF